MKRLLGLAVAVMMLCGVTAFAADTTAKSPAGKAELTVKKEGAKKPHRHHHHRRHHHHHKMMKMNK